MAISESGNFIPHNDSKKLHDPTGEVSHGQMKEWQDDLDSQAIHDLKNKKSGNILNKIKIDFEHVDQEHSEYGTANVYEATVTFNGKSEKFPFTDSINAHNNGDEPKGKDVLYSLLMDITSPDEHEEFCGEMCYDKDSMKGFKIFEAVQKEKKQMNKLFSSSEIDKLQKEFQDY